MNGAEMPLEVILKSRDRRDCNNQLFTHVGYTCMEQLQ